jgi:hypothetical protein
MKRLGITLVASADESAEQHFSMATLAIRDDEEAEDGNALGMILVELLTYIADVLSDLQDRVANEAYLESDWDEEADVLRIRMPAGVGAACCIVADDQRTYVVTIGPETEATTVHFGDGLAGARPPTGSEDIGAAYRGGPGEAGSLELSGMGLRGPLAIMLVGDSRPASGCLHVWRSRDGSGS